MKFLIRTEFTPPTGLGEAVLASLHEREVARSAELQRAGTIVHLWREPDTYVSWGLWMAKDAVAVRSALETLPCSTWMAVQIRAVIDHPNALAEATQLGSHE
jgi:muconolactone D-isomerase